MKKLPSVADSSVCGDGLQIINQKSALSQSIIVIKLENSLFTYFSDSGVQMK